MAYATDIRSAGRSFGATILERVAALRAARSDRAAKAKVYRTTIAELSSLNDRDLADLGIYRVQIEGIARQAAYGEN